MRLGRIAVAEIHDQKHAALKQKLDHASMELQVLAES